MFNKSMVVLHGALISILITSYGVMAEGNWMTKWTNPDGTISNPTPATFYEVDTQNSGEMMQVMGYYGDSKRNRLFGKYTNEGEKFEGFWIQDNSEEACAGIVNGSKHYGRVWFKITGDDSFAGKWGYCDEIPSLQWSGTRINNDNDGTIEVISGSEFKAGLWSGKSFAYEETGEWAECYVYRLFPNDFYLGFSATPTDFILYLTHREIPIFKDVNTVQIARQIDRNAPTYLTAEKYNDETISVLYEDVDDMLQLKKGNTLTLSSIFGSLRFSLKGSSRALTALFDCASKYENYGAASNQAQGSAGSSSKKTFGAIAFSRDTGANGYSFQYDNLSGAEARALKECSAYASDCTVASSFSDACGALAVGDGNGWGSSRAESIIKAERNALATCRSYDNKNCEIKVSICSYD